MRFSTVAILATGASASIVARDTLSTIQGVISTAGNDVDKINSAANSYDGSNNQPLISASEGFISDLESGVSTVKALKTDLTLAQALGLQTPVKTLTTKAQTLEKSLVAKRSTIEKAGQCGTVRKYVGTINTDSLALIDAVVDKVPEEAQSIAEGLSADLKAVLVKTVNDFSESNCVDAAGSGSGSSSSAAGSSSSAAAGSSSGYASTSAAASTTAAAATSAASSGVAAPTGATTPVPAPTTSSPPVVTAGAAIAAPAGALALALAIFAL